MDPAGFLLFKCAPNPVFVTACHPFGLFFGGPEKVGQMVRSLLTGVPLAVLGVEGFRSRMRDFIRVLFGPPLFPVSKPVAR
jgi:hypothetical protein